MPVDLPPDVGFVYTPSPTHTKTFCVSCLDSVWIGAKQRAKQEENPSAKVLCMVCALKHMKQDADISHLGGVSGSYSFKDTQDKDKTH